MYSYMFKLQSLSKFSLSDTIHLSRFFFPLHYIVFWACQFWCLLVLLSFFCFTTSTSAKHFPLRAFFHPGRQTKVAGGEIRWLGRVGHRVMTFWIKNCSAQCGQVCLLINHPSWNGQTHWKGLQKKFTEAKCSLSQHHQLVHWPR